MMNNYKKIENLVKRLGKPLVNMSGSIEDIGRKKKWLTKQDLFIETEITKLIKTFGPNHEVYAEELHESFTDCENLWVVDPISNTRGFIKGFYHFSIVLSYLYKGVLQFALVYDPTVDEMFTAYKDKGAFLNGERISVNTGTEDLCFLFTPKERKPFSAQKSGYLVKELLELGQLYSIGSAGLRYAYVACGRADCAITVNKDSFSAFAGKLLLEEAEGKFTDFYENEISEEPRGVIASRKDLCPQVRAIISKILE